MRKLIPSLMGLVGLVGCNSNTPNHAPTESGTISNLARQVAKYAKEHGEKSPIEETSLTSRTTHIIGEQYRLVLTDKKTGKIIVINYSDLDPEGEIGEGDNIYLGEAKGNFKFKDANLDGFFTSQEKMTGIGTLGGESAYFWIGNKPIRYDRDGLGIGTDDDILAINKKYKQTLTTILNNID